LRKFSTAAKILVSAAILLILFRKANLQTGIHFVGAIDWFFILPSVALIVLAQLARAYRLALMIFGASAEGRFFQVLRIQMVSFLPGIVSPAKIGEAAKIYMLQADTGTRLGRATACFVAERVLDMLLLVPLASLGVYLLIGPSFSFSFQKTFFALVIVLTGTAACVPLGLAYARRKGVRAADIWDTAKPSKLLAAGGITMLYWGMVFAEVWCFCRAALFGVTLRHISLAVPPALLSSLLPVSFSGFGVREAALVFLLQRPQLGATYNQALLVSLMYIVFGLGVPALMGLIYWWVGRSNVSQN